MRATRCITWLSVVLIGFATSCSKQRGEPCCSQVEEEPVPEEDLCDLDAPFGAVDWNQATALGLTPSEAFATVKSCEATLRWALPSRAASVEPPASETELKLELSLDTKSARLPRALVSRGCEQSLQVDADMSLLTADGQLKDRGRVKLSLVPNKGATATLELAAPGGALRISPRAGRRASLEYQASFRGGQCAGILSALYRLPSDDPSANTATPMQRPEELKLGAWSSSGCASDAEPVPVDATTVVSARVALLRSEWQDASYPVVWEDGSATRLRVSVELAGGFICQISERIGSLPLRISYGTDDERIATHTVDGSASFIVDAQVLRLLRIRTSEHSSCKGVDDALPFADANCAQVSAVDASLSLTGLGDVANGAMAGALQIAYRDGAGRPVGATQLISLGIPDREH